MADTAAVAIPATIDSYATIGSGGLFSPSKHLSMADDAAAAAAVDAAVRVGHRSSSSPATTVSPYSGSVDAPGSGTNPFSSLATGDPRQAPYAASRRMPSPNPHPANDYASRATALQPGTMYDVETRSYGPSTATMRATSAVPQPMLRGLATEVHRSGGQTKQQPLGQSLPLTTPCGVPMPSGGGYSGSGGYAHQVGGMNSNHRFRSAGQSGAQSTQTVPILPTMQYPHQHRPQQQQNQGRQSYMLAAALPMAVRPLSVAELSSQHSGGGSCGAGGGGSMHGLMYGVGPQGYGGGPGTGSFSSRASSAAYDHGMGGGVGHSGSNGGGSAYGFGHNPLLMPNNGSMYYSVQSGGGGGAGVNSTGSAYHAPSGMANQTSYYGMDGNQAGRTASYRLDGGAYGSLGGASAGSVMYPAMYNNNANQHSNQQQQQQQQQPVRTCSLPSDEFFDRAHSTRHTNAGDTAQSREDERGLYAAGTESSFYKSSRSVERQRQPSARPASQRDGAESSMFMQSVTSEILPAPEQPPRWKRAARRDGDGPPPTFTAEESVQCDARPSSSRRKSSFSVLLSRLPSQRSMYSMASSNRGFSEREDSAAGSRRGSAQTSQPSVFRRFADHVTRIGRDAKSELLRKFPPEKPQGSRPGAGASRDAPRSVATPGSEDSRFFNGSMSFSDGDDERGSRDGRRWTQKQSSSSTHRSASTRRSEEAGSSGSVPIFVRRRVRVKALDMRVIAIALQDRG